MDVSPFPLPLLILLGVVGYVVCFAAFWCGVVALISVISGWGKLARLYPSPGPAAPGDGGVQQFIWASLYMNGARYKSCLTVTLRPEGIEITPWLLFRANHPPLLIPWSAVAECVGQRGWIGQTARLTLGPPTHKTLHFPGSVGQALLDYGRTAANRL